MEKIDATFLCCIYAYHNPRKKEPAGTGFTYSCLDMSTHREAPSELPKPQYLNTYVLTLPTEMLVLLLVSQAVNITAEHSAKSNNWFNAHIHYCTTHIVLGVTDWFTASITADGQWRRKTSTVQHKDNWLMRWAVHEHHGHRYTTIFTNATTVYLKSDLCQPSVDKTMHGLHEATSL